MLRRLWRWLFQTYPQLGALYQDALDLWASGTRPRDIAIAGVAVASQNRPPLVLEEDVLDLPIQIIMAHGAEGSDDALGDFIEAGIRLIGVAAAQDAKAEWANKYGTDFENDTFMMHRFCWCEQDDCAWCCGNEPNFRHKGLGLEVRWYKYIGRGMEISNPNYLNATGIARMVLECLDSLS